ncbi:MAG: flagellar biosynthetic protein FliO [Desulfovibrio sp.]|nr:flagellar biosynthetic protein FliO [Desulfovibrio sp.]
MALLWFLVRLLRKYGRFNFIPRHDTLPRDAFFMEAQMPLGPRKNLVVVRFLERRLLIGVTEKEVRLLAEERTDAGQAEAEASFAAYLKEDSHDVSK